MDEMTIADLANALRGIPRDALVLIDTPDGLKRLRMVVGTSCLPSFRLSDVQGKGCCGRLGVYGGTQTSLRDVGRVMSG